MRLCRGPLALLVLLAVVSTRAPLAAQPLDRSGAGALTGTFASADALTVVVRTDEQALVTFSVEDQASVPAGLVPGMRVTVRYDVDDDGRYHVVRVGAASYPPEAGSTTSLPPPPAAAPTPGPPAASPTPLPEAAAVLPVARQAAPEPDAVARMVEERPRARPAEKPLRALEEPPREASAPVAREAAAPSKAPSPSRTAARGPDVLKIGGLLLTAAGLAALAYAFARRHA
jgi:hypothetical protein